MKKCTGYIQINELINNRTDLKTIAIYSFDNNNEKEVFEQLQRVFHGGNEFDKSECIIDLLDSDYNIISDPIGISKSQADWLTNKFMK